MYRKLISMILFLIALSSLLSALPSKDICEAAFLPKEIGGNEKIAVHPHGHSIAYSIHQKPLEGFPNVTSTSSGVPSNRFYSQIYLRTLNSEESRQIGPTNANCWRPQFSPDGKKIAFYSDEGGSNRLWIYDINLSTSSCICDELIYTHSLAYLDRPYWSHDSNIIYFPILPIKIPEDVSKEGKNEANVSLYSSSKAPSCLTIPLHSRIASVNLATENHHVLCPSIEKDPLSTVFIPSKMGTYIAYLSLTTATSPPSFDLQVFSTLDPQKTFTIAKQFHLTSNTMEFAWHPHQEKLAYIKKNRVYIASWDINGVFCVEELSKDYDAVFSATPLNFSSDGKVLLVGAHLFNYGYSKPPKSLFLFSLEGASPQQISIPEEWHYRSTLETENSFFWQPHKDSVTIYVKNSTENAIIRILLMGGSQHHEILWRGVSFLEGMVTSEKTNQIFYVEESLNTSQTLYQASFDFSNITYLSQIDPKQYLSNDMTAITFETCVPRYDGSLETVKTVVILPINTNFEGPLPAIVHIYPGALLHSSANHYAGGSTASFPTRLLLEQGYAVVCPDLQISPLGSYGNPLQESVDRLLPQIYHAVNLGLIDINRLGLIGQSYGGYGTAGISSKTTLFRASVCVSGLYDLAGCYGLFSMRKEWEGFADTDYYENRQARMGTHPWDDVIHYIENSPYYLADNIYNPLLLIHGENDTTYPVGEAQKMFTALKRLGKEVDLAIYKNEGHVIYKWSYINAIDAVSRIIRFFDLHLSSLEQD